MKLANQVAIVTGGGSSIGLAITEMLLQQGVNVAISSRREQLIKQTAVELNDRYEANVIAVAGDVRRKQDMQRLVQETFAAFGTLIR